MGRADALDDQSGTLKPRSVCAQAYQIILLGRAVLRRRPIFGRGGFSEEPFSQPVARTAFSTRDFPASPTHITWQIQRTVFPEQW
jgi:hypothetical protein